RSPGEPGSNDFARAHQHWKWSLRAAGIAAPAEELLASIWRCGEGNIRAAGETVCLRATRHRPEAVRQRCQRVLSRAQGLKHGRDGGVSVADNKLQRVAHSAASAAPGR